MHAYQTNLLDSLLESGAIALGDFTLKSGRKSPYFVNLGKVASGQGLQALGDAYADYLQASGIDCDMLFGPAYKGIPLVSATAVSLAARHQRDVPFAYDRKEAKDHGEGGLLVGTAPAGRVVIVDDVITAGTAIRGSVELLRQNGAQPVAVIVAMDRLEPGPNGPPATVDVARSLDIEVHSLITARDLATHLRHASRDAEAATIEQHLDDVGAARQAGK